MSQTCRERNWLFINRSLPEFEIAMLVKRGGGVIVPSSSPREIDKSAGVDRLGQEALRRHRQHWLFDRGRRPVPSFQHLPELFDFGGNGLLEFPADMIESSTSSMMAWGPCMQ